MVRTRGLGVKLGWKGARGWLKQGSKLGGEGLRNLETTLSQIMELGGGPGWLRMGPRVAWDGRAMLGLWTHELGSGV